MQNRIKAIVAGLPATLVSATMGFPVGTDISMNT